MTRGEVVPELTFEQEETVKNLTNDAGLVISLSIKGWHDAETCKVVESTFLMKFIQGVHVETQKICHLWGTPSF